MGYRLGPGWRLDTCAAGALRFLFVELEAPEPRRKSSARDESGLGWDLLICVPDQLGHFNFI